MKQRQEKALQNAKDCKSAKEHFLTASKDSCKADRASKDPPADNKATGKEKGHAFDPTDMRVYEFFIQGAPNPKDLEGAEEDQLLDIQRTIQVKLKERDAERERNITLQRG